DSLSDVLSGNDPEQVYRGLWVSSYLDSPSTIKMALNLLNHKSAEIRFVSAWILTQMKLEPAVRVKMPLTDDENLQVALMAAVGTDGIRLGEDFELDLEVEDVFDQEQFERLERLYHRLPEKPAKLDAILWPWTERKIDRKIISGQFLQVLGDRSPTRMIPYFKGLQYWELRETIREIGNQKNWDELTRQTLVSLTGDLSQDVREAAFEAFENQTLQGAEYQTVEVFLKRKSVDLRNGILKLILRGNDSEILQCAERLLACRDANQRQAGLELLRQMAENGRERPQCQALADTFAKSQKDLSKDELTQIDAIGRLEENPVTLNDGLGLLDNSRRTPVVKPQKNKRERVTKAAVECLKSLDALVSKHRQTVVRTRSWRKGRYEEKPLGECRWYELPKIQPSKPLSPQIEKFPLSEVWYNWFHSRPAKQKDKDGLELIRALLATDIVDDWQYDDFKKGLKKQDQRELAETILGNVDFPDLEYPSIVTEILKMLFYSEIPAGVIDYLLDCNENALAHVSQEMIEELVNPNEKKRKKRNYWDDDEENDWRESFLFKQWPQLLNQYLHQTGVKLTQEQSRRYWQIQRFFDEPCAGVPRQRPDLERVLDSLRAGHATLDDLIDCLICDEGSDDRSFYELGRITSRILPRHLKEKMDGISGINRLVDQIRERIVEIELNRGETPTAATKPALAIKTLWGGETLFRIMSALNQNKIKVERGWRSESAESRIATLTHLMKITQPTESDNFESFRDRVQVAIQQGYCSEERLLDLAFLAPQWSRLVGEYLDWEGFSEGLYWFLAHMNTWFSGATEAAAVAEGLEDDTDEDSDENEDDDWDSENETDQPEKLNAWERLIQERTPLNSQERSEGAVDVAWFHRTWELLGEMRWKQMAESAKFAANSSQAKKAQFLTDVLLGNKSRSELIEGIQKKNLKEYVRLLGLLPLETGKKRESDIHHRFAVMQDYRRYARKLSSLTKPEALRAVEIGLNNLARLSGYSDPLRLEWALEAESTRDLAQGAIHVSAEGVTVTLELDSEIKPKLTVTKAGKPLKTIPAALKKKHESIAELADRASELKKKASQSRRSLEQAMCRADLITVEELVQLTDHALVGPLLKNLVLIGEGIAGYPDKGGKVLRDYEGHLEPIKKGEKLRIAHPVDLLEEGQWDRWQKDCFQAERVQPFRQIFRELYVVTDQERADDHMSRRFSGHQINPRQAFSLFNSREWNTADGVSKIFHDFSIMAVVEFQDDTATAAEVEGLTIESVRFIKPDTYQPVALSQIPKNLFSEVMRDIDLVVSVAHRGEVDPEASASTVEMRTALIRETCTLLGLENVNLQKDRAFIKGEYGEYSLHLGSGGIHMMPGGSLAILPVHAQHRGRLFLPFADDDPKTAEIISKVLLLAKDQEIQDPTILSQLGISRKPQVKPKLKSKTGTPTSGSSRSKTKSKTNTPGDPEPQGEVLTRESRRFEMTEGKSNKFWEIELIGHQIITRWGRIGTAGQSSVKTFDDSSEAGRKYESLVNEKTGKGYREIS
ncbi:MAG: hypothetical protein RJA81_1785, partial [Planctomycetota bacterium]